MCELYGIDRSVIGKHLKKIFSDGELEENSVCAIFAHTADNRRLYHYLTSENVITDLQAEAESQSSTFPQIRFNFIIKFLYANLPVH